MWGSLDVSGVARVGVVLEVCDEAAEHGEVPRELVLAAEVDALEVGVAALEAHAERGELRPRGRDASAALAWRGPSSSSYSSVSSSSFSVPESSAVSSTRSVRCSARSARSTPTVTLRSWSSSPSSVTVKFTTVTVMQISGR